MITREQLEARRVVLLTEVKQQSDLAHKALADQTEASTRLGQHNQLIHSLNGALQDVDHWLKTLPVEPKPDLIEVPKDSAPNA